MNSPFCMGIVHDKGIWASIGPAGHLRTTSPFVRILRLRRHLVELDVILMVNIELEPSGIGSGRLFLYDLPCAGPGRGIVLVVTVFGGSPKLRITVLYKLLMPLLTNPCGLQIVPLYRLLIGGQLTVLDILIMDGVKVYGPLDLFRPVPVFKRYVPYPPCLCLLLDRLAQPSIDLPVGLSLKHRLHPPPAEGEEGGG